MTRSQILDDAEALLNSGIEKDQRILYSALVDLLREIDTKGGRLILDQDTINLINQAEKEIYKALNESKYDSRVNRYLKDFDLIKYNIIKEQSVINGINVAERALNQIQKLAIKQTENMLLGNGLDYNLVQPVRDVLIEAASTGMSRAQAEVNLRTVILGDEERFGKLQRYVTQISRDAISQYEGLLQQKISEEFDLDCFSFEGSLIKDSRPACVKLVNEFNGVIKKSELQEFINWAYANSTGMIPGTNPNNWPSLRNGYNCRHTVTAIRC